MEDGIKFIYKDYQLKKNKATDISLSPSSNVANLIINLTLNKDLTTWQYDVVLKYLCEERDRQRKVELQEFPEDLVYQKKQRYEILSKRPFLEYNKGASTNDLSRMPPSGFDSIKSLKSQLLSDEKVRNALNALRMKKTE